MCYHLSLFLTLSYSYPTHSHMKMKKFTFNKVFSSIVMYVIETPEKRKAIPKAPLKSFSLCHHQTHPLLYSYHCLSSPHSRSKSSERQTFFNVIKLKFYTLWLWDGRYVGLVKRRMRIFLNRRKLVEIIYKMEVLCCCLFVC